MKLFVGLGNPGSKYANTRHNAGFMVIDQFCQQQHLSLTQEKFQALYVKTKIQGVDVLIAKPLTFMNESGKAVQALAHFYQIEVQDIIVVHDDMDLPMGKVRLRPQGSSGGQKGMASVINCLHTQEIKRIRMGVGHAEKGQVVDYVLGKFPKEEQALFAEACLRAATALEFSLTHSFMETMNHFN